MTDKIIGNSTIVITANASKVWDALTNPVLVKQYFFGTTLLTDWKVGSSIKFTGEWEGKTYEDKGIVLAYEINKLLTYTYWSSMSGKEDRPENYQTISYHLSEKGDKTTLVITQQGIASEKEKEHSEKNWQGVLEGLKKLVETNHVSA